MKLAGARWRTLHTDARVDGRTVRVVQPARVPKHAALYEGYLGAQMLIDKPAAMDLAAAWWLAARSPRTAVWLPLRRSPTTCGDIWWERRLDLVLMHHSLALPVSKWKQARTQTRNPRPHTVTLPGRPFPEFSVDAVYAMHHEGYRDHLRYAFAADTLFVIGSRHAFELQARAIRNLVEDCPAHMAKKPDAHCCAEIELGDTSRWSKKSSRNPWSMLHIEYCDTHR